MILQVNYLHLKTYVLIYRGLTEELPKIQCKHEREGTATNFRRVSRNSGLGRKKYNWSDQNGVEGS